MREGTPSNQYDFSSYDRGRWQPATPTVVLVDDVLTSGATSDACARALLRAGARNVDLLVFARVVDAVQTPI